MPSKPRGIEARRVAWQELWKLLLKPRPVATVTKEQGT